MKSPLVRIMLGCFVLLVLLTIPVAMHINPPGDIEIVRIALGMRHDAVTSVIGILTLVHLYPPCWHAWR